MNNIELQDLARKAVALPGWRWWWTSATARPYGLPGWYQRRGGEWVRCADVTELSQTTKILPDISDPAVGGVLLEMLRPCLAGAWYSYDDREWLVEIDDGVFTRAPHLAAACALAAVALGGWPEAP